MAGPLLLAGCGKMGGALLDGWLDQGLSAADVIVIEPDPETARTVAEGFGVKVVSAPDDLDPDLSPETVVFAVKPQAMDAVAPAYARFAAGDTLFLTIAAGKPIRYFEGVLGDHAAIVRAMPNTPAAVRRGITVACANARASDEQVKRCDGLLEAVGWVAWIDDEALMDAVTAVSGSGPAYVFLLAQCLAEAGAEAGLPAELALRLARATVAGAGELLHRAEETPETLRMNVTSPGGTTAAALDVLMADGGLSDLMVKAVAAAKKRSRELAG